MDDLTLPEELTPINLKAYFYNAFNMCGCWEFGPVHYNILFLLKWLKTNSEENPKKSYETLYDSVGIFYLLVGIFDRLNLIEHGISIRCAWLTNNGKRLLEALLKYSPEEIDSAEGKAYDECEYAK